MHLECTAILNTPKPKPAPVESSVPVTPAATDDAVMKPEGAATETPAAETGADKLD